MYRDLPGIKGLNYKVIAKSVKGMPFLADPPIPDSEKHRGVFYLPGFHTTTDIDIAIHYALDNIYHSQTKENDDGTHYVTDYPVVVGINMQDFEKKTDYDAEESVKQTLLDQLQTFIEEKNIDESTPDEDILNEAQDFIYELEMQDSENEPADDINSFSWQNVSRHFDVPFITLYSSPTFLNAVKTYLLKQEVTPEDLMFAAKQYRYENDVDEDRIGVVYYVMPLAKTIYDEYTEEGLDIDEAWPGFDIKNIDEVYSGSLSFNTEKVYENPSIPVESLEWHGTTFFRLKEAAPNLELPEPPSPPFDYK